MIGAYFFENDDGTTITVNSEHYGHMITDFFLLVIIEEYNLESMWFQQDGATCNTTLANMALLQETFPGRVISRRGDISLANKIMRFDTIRLFCETTRKTVCMLINLLEHLKTNIRQVLAEIPPNMC